jgi:hypothetical protein
MRGLSARRGIAATSATLPLGPRRSESRRGPLTLVRYAHSTSPRAAGRGDNTIPLSRCNFASESCHSTARRPFVPPLKEGRRSAEAHHGSPPRRRKKSLPAMRRALYSPPAPHWRGVKRRRARLSALHRDYAPSVLSLDSAPGRASWNHRIQTGVPSPAPVQPAPGSPITRRTVDAQNHPDERLQASSGNRTRPIDRLSPVDVPSMGELAYVTKLGTIVNGLSLF